MELFENEVPIVLIVDDVELNAELLKGMIHRMGFIGRTATSAKEAIEQIRQELPQLIMLDIVMPDIDGYQMCEMLKANPVTRQIPVIFVSAAADISNKKRAFEVGAVDFINKPLDYSEVLMRVSNHLKMYKMQQQLEENNRRLNKVISEQAQKFEEEQKRLLKAIAKLTESSEYVGLSGHLENVSVNARLMAQALNFTDRYENQISNSFVEAIEMAAAVHDIGKITISEQILTKPAKLTAQERSVINTHTSKGDEILRAAYPDVDGNHFMQIALEVVRSHHENWDGSGYPDGLRGEEIPLSARIMRIVDSYDCLLGERCYKKPYTREAALKEMEAGRDKKYDPYLLDIFFKIERQLKKG